MNSFLNPQSPPSWDFFLPRAGWLILKYGMPALRQAVGGGQYEYPKGIMFGGKRLEQGPQEYQAFLAQRLSAAEQVFAIDVHTGLGKYGEDTLLVEARGYDKARKMFGERVAPLDSERGPAYRASGAIDSMVPRVLPKARVYLLTQEFGTYSSVKVLRALREENRWDHYGDGTVNHPTKQKLKEIFGPEDESWRRSVLARGRELLKQAMELAFANSK